MNNLRIFNIPETCTGCGACTSSCPKQCIELKANQDGFYYPTITNDDCIQCHLCEKVCHIITPIENKPISRRNFFAYKTKEEVLRQQSTSGGAFSLFAQYVLDQGGVVYGSKYNGDKERLEVCGSDLCGLEPLRKSKYIESFLGNSFAEIRKQLLKGRLVLYCGTPCQAAGLRHYIEKTKTPSEKLIIIDFACHGVPSNGFFTRFKRRFESDKRKVIDAEFRVKDPGDPKTSWHIQTLRLSFSDGTKKVFRRNSLYYYYYWPFDVSVSLRRSCYDCHQVDFSCSDITIGDFWDIKNYPQIKDDNKGFSFVKINNESILPLFFQIAVKGFMEKLPDDLISDPYNKPSKLAKIDAREQFLILTREFDYYEAVRRYFGRMYIYKNTFVFQIKRFIIDCLSLLRFRGSNHQRK